MKRATLDRVVYFAFDKLQDSHRQIMIDHLPPGKSNPITKHEVSVKSRKLVGKSEIPSLLEILPPKHSKDNTIFDIDAKKYLQQISRLERAALEEIEHFHQNKKKVDTWVQYAQDKEKDADKLRTWRRMTDALIATDCLRVAAATYNTGQATPYSEAIASSFYIADIFFRNSPNLSLLRTAATTISSWPVLNYIASALAGNTSFESDQFRMLAIPAISALSMLTPVQIFLSPRINLKAYTEGNRLEKTRAANYTFFSDSKKLTYALSEVRKLQLTPDVKDAPKNMLDEFESICNHYIAFGEGKNRISEQRKLIRDHLRKKNVVHKIFALESRDDVETAFTRETEELEKLVQEQEDDSFAGITSTGKVVSEETQNVMNLLMPYGISEQQALKIGNRIQYTQAFGIIERLKIVLGNRHSEIIKTYPKIVLMPRDVADSYFSNLGTAVERGASLQELTTPKGVKTAVARLGITDLVKEETLEQRYASALRDAGYHDFQSLQAVVVNGFRLNSSRARIAMAYSKYIDIKRAARPHFADEEMRGFEDIFAKLIADKAILTDKIGKARGAGGRFQGAYSLNPQVSDIANPALKKFLAETMYGRYRD